MARPKIPDVEREARRERGNAIRRRREALGLSRWGIALVANTSPSNVQPGRPSRSAR
jgi:hypothetical protein